MSDNTRRRPGTPTKEILKQILGFITGTLLLSHCKSTPAAPHSRASESLRSVYLLWRVPTSGKGFQLHWQHRPNGKQVSQEFPREARVAQPRCGWLRMRQQCASPRCWPRSKVSPSPVAGARRLLAWHLDQRLVDVDCAVRLHFCPHHDEPPAPFVHAGAHHQFSARAKAERAGLLYFGLLLLGRCTWFTRPIFRAALCSAQWAW